jgi:RNA polymerase sigma factor (sigma-70 family)
VLRSIQTDQRLAERASRGDQRALAAIFTSYHEDLFRYCAALLGNAEDAADALQNTMVKVLGGLPGERRAVQLKPWLYRIAHNESVELLRKRRDLEAIDPEAFVSTESPEASAEVRERLRQLIADLRELPERQRGSLVMRELSGLSFEQIGAAFETSAAVARQTVYEARLGLRQMEKGRAMGCDEVRRKLSDGDRRALRRRDLRAHLRRCSGCREFEAEIAGRQSDLAAISPLPALAAAALLKGALGGGVGSAGGAATGAGVAGGAISSSAAVKAGAISSSTAVKAVATLAVAGAIGVGVADRAEVVRIFDREASPATTSEHHLPAPAADGSAAPRIADRAVGEGGHSVANDRSVATARSAAAQSPRGQRADFEPPNAPGALVGPPGREAPSPTPPGRGRGHAKVTGEGAGPTNAHGGNPHGTGDTHGAASEGKTPPGKGKQEGKAKPAKVDSSKTKTTAGEAPAPGQSGEASGKADQAPGLNKPEG